MHTCQTNVLSQRPMQPCRALNLRCDASSASYYLPASSVMLLQRLKCPYQARLYVRAGRSPRSLHLVRQLGKCSPQDKAPVRQSSKEQKIAPVIDCEQSSAVFLLRRRLMILSVERLAFKSNDSMGAQLSYSGCRDTLESISAA